ncbi:polyketide synthase, putative [Aspergillus udagawae]|uniref:Polyketide synthase, putative, partial n=1 Tax=Aspergillus udagawae TaxID=91492 RepID=A0ABQ1AFU2_9EURO|nr:polyketide synthase, putative [Aspergillus udagawae]
MPDDVQAILRGYEPSDTSDDAVHVLRETFKYLPADGRRNLVQDIVEAGAQGKLQQLAQSIITGLLTPLKVAGDKTAEITPSSRIGLEDSLEDLAAMTDKSMTRVKQQQLRVEALRRDGNKCVISGEYDVNLEDEYPDEVTADLETAHIIPFAISKFDGDSERMRMVKIWSNMFHYFPSIRSRLNFQYDQINSLTNVMMLSAGMHKQFGRFSMTLEPTDTLNQYRVKTFRRFTRNLNNHLPKDGVVNLICYDGRYPLPSRELLGLHCSVAHILNATGRGVKIDRIMRDYGATGAFARDGGTNIAELLSVSNLTLLPTVDERGMNSKSGRAVFRDTRTGGLTPAEAEAEVERIILPRKPMKSRKPRNPLEQGFNAEEYDLVIASNVLHATPILHDTLSHARTLLRPQGRLFLQELSPITNCMVFIMGLFSGWWLGEADGRIEGPFLPPEEWDTRLRAAGFNGCETVTYDNERPYPINANIVARPAMYFEYPKQVSLLSGHSQIIPFALQLEILLRDKVYSPQHYQWGSEEQPPADQDLISFVDLDGLLLKDPTEKDWDLLLQTIQSLQEASVLWLTPSAQVNAKHPHAALILGVARTIRSEMDMPLATLELENIDTSEAAGAALNVFRRVQRCKDEMAELDPDMEFAWVNGAVHIGRFHWYPIPSALKATAASPDTKALAISKRGLLQTLRWIGRPLPELPADQVQVEMKAVGLNFTDVLIAMGVINSVDALGDGYNTFGLEGAGYVSKVGTDVDHVKPGDRVILIGTNSTGLATQVQRPGGFVLPIPDHLSFEDAATMPAVYVTVLLGLFDKAHLAKGQSILIHAAAGGVGIAAINIARWIGADIYCTVGSEEKADFLVKEFGIPRNRIFHSRNTSFHDDLMAATDGVGVDCVLNSVSGELLHTSWECVASSGCMVEIGRRDMIGRGQLALDKFEDNRTFIGADLSRYTVFNKPAVVRLMRMMLDLYIDGHITPVHPVTLFDAESVERAFRYMQQGIHIGKVVIKFPDAESSLPWDRTIPKPSFRGDRSYLLVGGMGGLGRAIATWMATHGAKHLIFLSRSAGKTGDDQAFIHELNLMGCAVQAWAGDVADPLMVHNAIEQAPMPIAGVMQMAMVLRDIGVMDMDLETYQAAIRPKVDGTWNLHNAVPNDELDFFVLFSSVCGMVGYYGQANYAAANTFLDAFVQYRHERGLRASVMDIGAVNDVGYISRTPAAKDAMLASAGHLITEQDFLDTLQLTIARSSQAPVSFPAASPELGTTGLQFQNPCQVTQALECRLPIMHPQNNIIWKRDPRMAIYRNIETFAGDNEATTSGIKPFLSSVNADPSQLDQPAAAEFLAGEIRDRVATFLMRREDEEPLDLGLTLSAAGVDSLVAIEVRNWWKQNLGVEVSVLELMNGGIRFHGGGFIVGHRTYEPWFAQWLLDLAQAHEAIIITPDYRLLPESNGADILSDIAHFWQWMQTSVVELASKSGWPFSLDLTRTLCCGESAGGYLAVYSALHLRSMISVMTNTSLSEEKQENVKPIVDIRAVISISAPLDTNAPELRVPRPRTFIGTRPPPPREAEARIRTYIKNIPPGAIRTGSKPTVEMWELVLCVSQQSYLPRLFGVKGNGQKAALSGIMESLEKWKEERSEGLPALWIVHGSGDTMIPPVCSRGFVKRLREMLPSVPVKLDVLPGEHLFDVDITMEEEWVTKGRGFLEHYWP